MKKIFYHSFAVILGAALILLSFTGCTKEYYTDEIININGAEATNYHFLIGNSNNADGDWRWNENNARYECFVSFKELTKNIYDYGSMVGAVFVEPGLPNEWLEMLPYQSVYYYNDIENNQIPYTVIVSCAFTPGEVGFFLQLSDRERDDNILANYEFRVTLLWDDYNLPN